jgi:hypothetical protein
VNSEIRNKGRSQDDNIYKARERKIKEAAGARRS